MHVRRLQDAGSRDARPTLLRSRLQFYPLAEAALGNQSRLGREQSGASLLEMEGKVEVSRGFDDLGWANESNTRSGR
jgi:hypothetical protein